MRLPLAVLATLFYLASFPNLAFGDEHHTARYVPWGVDEYELFSLTPSELSNRFKGKLRFEDGCSHAYIWDGSNRGPQFLIGFQGGRVSSVQRLFIDGGGCNILGPKLMSKEEALKFSIDGLSELPGGGDQGDHKRLVAAQKLLQDLSHPGSAPSQKKTAPSALK